MEYTQIYLEYLFNEKDREINVISRTIGRPRGKKPDLETLIGSTEKTIEEKESPMQTSSKNEIVQK